MKTLLLGLALTLLSTTFSASVYGTQPMQSFDEEGPQQVKCNITCGCQVSYSCRHHTYAGHNESYSCSESTFDYYERELYFTKTFASKEDANQWMKARCRGEVHHYSYFEGIGSPDCGYGWILNGGIQRTAGKVECKPRFP